MITVLPARRRHVRSDRIGQQFGPWRVIGRAQTPRRPDGKPGNVRWWLRCACGSVKAVQECQLRSRFGVRCRACHARGKAPGPVLPPPPPTLAELTATIRRNLW